MASNFEWDDTSLRRVAHSKFQNFASLGGIGEEELEVLVATVLDAGLEGVSYPGGKWEECLTELSELECFPGGDSGDVERTLRSFLLAIAEAAGQAAAGEQRQDSGRKSKSRSRSRGKGGAAESSGHQQQPKTFLSKREKAEREAELYLLERQRKADAERARQEAERASLTKIYKERGTNSGAVAAAAKDKDANRQGDKVGKASLSEAVLTADSLSALGRTELKQSSRSLSRKRGRSSQRSSSRARRNSSQRGSSAGGSPAKKRRKDDTEQGDKKTWEPSMGRLSDEHLAIISGSSLSEKHLDNKIFIDPATVETDPEKEARMKSGTTSKGGGAGEGGGATTYAAELLPEIKAFLRRFSQPVTLFGETEGERFQRYKDVEMHQDEYHATHTEGISLTGGLTLKAALRKDAEREALLSADEEDSDDEGEGAAGDAQTHGPGGAAAGAGFSGAAVSSKESSASSSGLDASGSDEVEIDYDSLKSVGVMAKPLATLPSTAPHLAVAKCGGETPLTKQLQTLYGQILTVQVFLKRALSVWEGELGEYATLHENSKTLSFDPATEKRFRSLQTVYSSGAFINGETGLRCDRGAYNKLVFRECKLCLKPLKRQVQVSEKLVRKKWAKLLEKRGRLVEEANQANASAGTSAASAKLQEQIREEMAFDCKEQQGLDNAVCRHLAQMALECDELKYQAADEEYMRLAIGNAAWPMGVTAVGIHARKATSEIAEANIAHVLSDEATRKYIHSFKRLMSYCRVRWPAAGDRGAGVGDEGDGLG